MLKNKMLRIVRCALLLAAVLLLTACPAYRFLGINYYWVRSSTFGGDLYALLVYDGIYAGIKPPPPPQDLTSSTQQNRGGIMFRDNPYSTQSEGEQLADAVRELDNTLAKEGRAMLDSNEGIGLANTDAKESATQMSETEQKEKPAGCALLKHWASNYEVRFGGYFCDTKTGRLSAYQVVRFKDARKFISLLNAAIAENPEPLLGDNFKKEGDAPTAKRKQPYLSLHGSALRYHYPIPPENAEEARANFWKDAAGTFPFNQRGTTDTLPVANFWAQSCSSVLQTSKEITLQLGSPDIKTNRIVRSANLSLDAAKNYSDNLTEIVSKQANWKGTLDTASVVREFEKSPKVVFDRLPVCIPPAKDDAKETK